MGDDGKWTRARLWRRTTRPCASCGAPRGCRWVIDAWLCGRCGDEWYPAHDPIVYASPMDSEPS